MSKGPYASPITLGPGTELVRTVGVDSQGRDGEEKGAWLSAPTLHPSLAHWQEPGPMPDAEGFHP